MERILHNSATRFTCEVQKMVMRNALPIALTLAICLGLGARTFAADDRLSKAKDLYRSAAYDEALALLDTVPLDAASTDAMEAREYRVYCLVALNRKDDAKKAISALVMADPSYRLPESQASPRVRAVFKEVRQSVLPSVVKRAYAEAKAAFDRKDRDAATQFERVLTLLRDPDLASVPEVADLAIVATAFRDLSQAIAVPPPVPAPPTTALPPTPATEPAAPAQVARRDNSTTANAGLPANVVPPVTVSQVIPAAEASQNRVWEGSIEVDIDETGKVVAARMLESVFPSYDRQLLRAAMNWTYRPALRNGVPSRYTKVISVRVDTRPACAGESGVWCRAPGAE